MTYRGHFKSGVVVLEGDARPPEGALVVVDVVEPEPVRAESGPTWADVFHDVIGKATGLPEDLADNHDHYIHGAPKR